MPKFKGVDFSVSTNTPGGGDFSNLQVVSAFRVDLSDPDIRLLTTPRNTNYEANLREVAGLTVSDFLRTNHLQAAINANFFDARNYYLPPGTPMDVYGLAVSDGVLVSEQEDLQHAAVLLFDAHNAASFISINSPPASLDGVQTAVAGNYPLVINGKNVISRATARETDPRTLFGLSQDRRYLYLVGIDGRQPGYSQGANDYESAGWLLLLGAWDGINMDGGGSTTLVVEDSTGVPRRLNKSSAVADSGRERTVGSHLGVFAKPLPGFINDVQIAPDDTTAQVRWTTIEPATSEVRYGLTPDSGTSGGVDNALLTNHLVQLSGLQPATSYYLQLVSSSAAQQFTSPTYSFVTTNYVSTNQLFDLTNSWKFTTTPLEGTEWTSPAYDDATWSGPGPGLFWVDVRAAGPNSLIQPRNTQMPADPSSGYPYISYYFRTHFALSNLVANSSLAFTGFIDDGAVFYLNGVEIYRLRLPDSADSQTLASSYPCEGDATCLDSFLVSAELSKNLKLGDNVLAVAVHNYNARSADITFGLSLALVEPLAREASLAATFSAGALTLSWDQPGFVLQSATSLAGPWETVSSQSPFFATVSDAQRYYRLRK